MGTRSTTAFIVKSKDGTEKQLCKVYQQFDGYLTGVGKEIAEFLLSGKLVNGIPGGAQSGYFNGLGCLAAQYIARFKTKAGGLYIVDSDDEQEFNYEILIVGDWYSDQAKIKVRYENKTYSPEDFLTFVNTPDPEEIDENEVY